MGICYSLCYTFAYPIYTPYLARISFNMGNIESFVKVRNLSFSREEKVIFSDINLDIPSGKITAVIGPSGTGKTTLLQMIGGLLFPDKGSVEIEGKNVHALSRKALYRLRCNMGMLFQNGALFTNLTAFENVAFPLREHTNFSEDKIREIVAEKLAAVRLTHASNLDANKLSGGMVRRVALARAIVLNPRLIMYDEPFTGLDPIALGVIVKLIREINDAFGMTTILVSHDVNETFYIADHVYMVDEGQVIASGTPEELFENGNPRVQRFLNGISDSKLSFDSFDKVYSNTSFHPMAEAQADESRVSESTVC